MKKLLAVMLVLAMVLTMLAGCGDQSGSNSNPGMVNAGKEILDKQLRAAFRENESFSGGTGTEEDPWLISTAEDLFRLADQINGETKDYVYREAHYRLTADIDLKRKDWFPIGVGYVFSRYGFCGVFDGSGHTVSGMKATSSAGSVIRDVGLFGSVSGTVKDLTVAASELDSSENENSVATGAIAGTLENGGILRNCHAAADVRIHGGYETGGIVGKSRGMVTDCTNAAMIFSDSAVGCAGGIAGEISGTRELDPINGIVKNCSNTGSVDSAGGDVGGIAGLILGETEMTGCANTGNIQSGENAGGLAGQIYSGEAAVMDCTNSGSVTGKESGGGIVGITSGGCVLQLSGCANSGNITDGKYMGGIVGMFMSSSQGMSLRVLECSNVGNITGSDPETIADAGGILGLAMAMGGDIDLENSTNSGEVDAGNGNGGGILGGYLGALGNENSTMTISITGCDNSGGVSGGSYGVGGIAGDIDAAAYPAVDLRITDCDNSGRVYARGTNVLLGGIVGTIEPHYSVSVIRNCHNSGNMTCDKTELGEGDQWFPFQAAMGGIVGYVGVTGLAPDGEDPYDLGDRIVVTIIDCSSIGSFNTSNTDIPVATDEICALSAVCVEIR